MTHVKCFNILHTYTHNYNTRGANSGKLHIPRCSAECFKRSLHYAGTQIWNNLNTDIKMSPSVQSLKTAYKHQFIN